LAAGTGISSAPDKVKKSVTPGDSPATAQSQNFFPNNPEEKKG
jgi:hypothetical protein